MGWGKPPVRGPDAAEPFARQRERISRGKGVPVFQIKP